jgi:DNA-binding transcriptional LysR family regulator
MNYDHLNTFLDLVETRNFNRTAERLDINQSTVSFRIRALEEALGARLFVRGRGGAELTPEGETFQSYALNLRLGWNLAKQELGMPSGFSGRLRMGMQVQLWDRLVNDWGVALRRHLPEVAIHIATDYSRAMTNQLVLGTLDIAVIYNPEHRPSLHVRHLFDEEFCMISTRPRTLAEVVPEEYVLITESPYFQARHAELLPHLEQPALSVSIGAMSAECLRDYGGAAYLPIRAVKPLLASGQFYTVEDAPTIHQPVYVAFHSRNRHRPYVLTALETLETIDINAEPANRSAICSAPGQTNSGPDPAKGNPDGCVPPTPL